jgi:hypothetical protein
MLPTEIETARRWLRARARYLCGGAARLPNGTTGRGKLDPVYVSVTQGRDFKGNWTKYSSCGDQLHALAVDFGVPIESSWINRDSPAWNKKWQFGTPQNDGRDNLSMLWAYGGPMHKTPLSYLPEPGDFLMVERPNGSGAHVCVAGNMISGKLELFNYGAGGMTNVEFPGSNCSLANVSAHDGALWINQKKLVRVLEVPRLIQLSKRLPIADSETLEALEASVP